MLLVALAVACVVGLVGISKSPVGDWWDLRTRAAMTEGTVTAVRQGARGVHLTVEYMPPGETTLARADLLDRQGTRAPVGSSVRFRFDPKRHSNVAPLGYDARAEFALLMTFVVTLLLGVCVREALRMRRPEPLGVPAPTSRFSSGAS